MSRALPVRAYQTAVRALARRDQLEMRAMNTLLSKIEAASRARVTPQAAPATRRKPTTTRPKTARLGKATRWTGLRSVLCPVDFSEPSRLALRYAAAIAGRGHASLTVFYANDPFLIAAAAAALHDRTFASRSQKELERFVADTLPLHARKGLAVTPLVSVGRPSAEIVRVAKQSRADLIVMGTHGLTGTDKVLLGSTTLSLLQRSAVPVLAVPSSGHARPRPPRPGWPGKWIATALDLDGGSKREAAYAAEVARWFGASLLLVHIVQHVAWPPWLGRALGTHDRLRVAEARARLETLAASLGPGLNTTVRVLLGNTADQIAALAAAHGIGLVTTTLREQQGWFGTRRGAISYHVLSLATTPVLALPARRARR